MTIDIIVSEIRWLAYSTYRNQMLARPKPPGTWRHVCRAPGGGIRVLAVTTFAEIGDRRVRKVEVK